MFNLSSKLIKQHRILKKEEGYWRERHGNTRLFRRHVVRRARSRELLENLMRKDDAALIAWGDENKDDITLDFLRWISDEESQSTDENEKKILGSLGSRLTAICLGMMPNGSTGQQDLEGDHELTEMAQSQAKLEGSASAWPIEGGSKRSPIRLSNQGMILMEQQAAAFEATIGIRKAETILQLLGRTSVSEGAPLHFVEKDVSRRILEVLVQVQDKTQRRVLLAEALVPATEDESEVDDSEEALSTTPFVLLQEVERCLKSPKQLENLEQDTLLQSSIESLAEILSDIKAGLMDIIRASAPGDAF
eukprot:jgi/Picsp_1/6392/NSC_03740-R1_---NA---